LAATEPQHISELLRQRCMRSPFNGVVTERPQLAGKMAPTGETARSILRKVQPHPLRVDVILPVSMCGKTILGVRANLDAEPPLASRYQANVSIYKVVDSASGTFGVRLDLPNLKSVWLADRRFARLRIGSTLHLLGLCKQRRHMARSNLPNQLGVDRKVVVCNQIAQARRT
jgi:hypothetical protein